MAQNRDRLPAICLSLVEWLDDASKEFKLASGIDEILEAETRYVGQDRIPIWQLKTSKHKFDEAYLKKLANQLGVAYADFKKEIEKHEELDVIVIEDEFRKDWADKFDLWEPLAEQTHLKTRCEKRKLISKPKYWFEKDDA